MNENCVFLKKFLNSFDVQVDFSIKNKFPKMLIIEVPSNCCPGYNCIFCQKKRDEEVMVDLQKLEERLKMSAKFNINTLAIAGSEPFNHPQILDIIRICSKYFSKISTFGLVERLKDVSFVKRVGNAGVTEISLPLYSIDEKIHNKIIGKNNFSETFYAIDNLRKNHINVFIHSVLIKDNLETLPLTEQYVRGEMGLPFTIIPFRPKNGVNDNNIIVEYSDILASLIDSGIVSLVGFPLCIQEQIQKKLVSQDEISSIMKLYVILQKFHKLKMCRLCKKNSLCNGLFRTNRLKYSYKAIRPFM